MTVGLAVAVRLAVELGAEVGATDGEGAASGLFAHAHPPPKPATASRTPKGTETSSARRIPAILSGP
ncbi:MAG: hypothetical protein A2Z17_02105 [Gammaproteobacteria bacterium RBG_16_66_13]|nr:MAG: hypothetical protein A2Z17_02105 [Gammaproteobacteria bacterium RBG_16_66_13]